MSARAHGNGGESRPLLLGGLCGFLAACVALGVANLLAAVAASRVPPIVAVGDAFVDLTPAWLRDFAIRVFGSNDKLVLIIGIVVVIGVLSAGIGIAARWRTSLGVAGVAALGAVGAAAAGTRPGAGAEDTLPPVMGAAIGALALILLTRVSGAPAAVATRYGPVPPPPPGREDKPGASTSRPTPTGISRRGFLAAGTGAATLAVTSGVAGRVFTGRRARVADSRAAIRLPKPASAAAPVPAGADLDVPNLSPFFTRTDSFYRVDTALRLPSVPAGDWSLRLHGLVEREIRLTFDELLKRPLIERDITLTCVSNEVGGPLAGNARWLGVPLADLLREAGVRPGADQILSRSADGWTCGTPTEVVMDGRDAMLAVAMNGKPLPLAHGFPVRMVVPGLYGYVSATKWVVDLKLTRFADARAYWVWRGWAARAPIKTMSRIETPSTTEGLRAGRVAVAGVAWAQHRGVERVEVRVDGGPWQEARLAPVPSVDTWRQWVYPWDATPGRHRLQVRATDGSGRVQPARRAPTYPDGASGWHEIAVTVA